jgi:hypothetical protein
VINDIHRKEMVDIIDRFCVLYILIYATYRANFGPENSFINTIPTSKVWVVRRIHQGFSTLTAAVKSMASLLRRVADPASCTYQTVKSWIVLQILREVIIPFEFGRSPCQVTRSFCAHCCSFPSKTLDENNFPLVSQIAAQVIEDLPPEQRIPADSRGLIFIDVDCLGWLACVERSRARAATGAG